MNAGIAMPIGAPRRLPAWALGLSLATHLAVLFGPAMQRHAAAVDLPPLAVTFRMPAVLAPAAAVVSAAPVSPTALQPAFQPVSKPVSKPVSRALPAAPRVPPVKAAVLATAPADNAPAARVAASPVAAPLSSPVVSSEPAPAARRAAEAAPVTESVDPAAMARYVRLLGDLLAQQQQYPRLAAARGWEGEVRLRLLVARKGTLIAVHIVHSSGFDVLDQHAVQLVQGTVLPPLPNAINAASPDLTIDIPIHYALKRS